MFQISGSMYLEVLLFHFFLYFSFQGPDWHYQTELPNWAKEDWDENAQEFGI